MPEILLSEVEVKDVCKLIVKEASTVKPNTSIENVLKIIVEDHNTRHVYVVDDDNKILGSIKFSGVIEYMFPFSSYGHKVDLNKGGLMNYKKSLIANDIMNTNPTSAKEDDKMPYIVELMNEKNISELPVVDSQNRVVGEINFLEIITYYLNTEN